MVICYALQQNKSKLGTTLPLCCKIRAHIVHISTGNATLGFALNKNYLCGIGTFY